MREIISPGQKQSNEKNPHRKQVLDYEAMAYNHSIDSRKYEPLFTLGEENNAAEE